MIRKEVKNFNVNLVFFVPVFSTKARSLEQTKCRGHRISGCHSQVSFVPVLFSTFKKLFVSRIFSVNFFPTNSRNNPNKPSKPNETNSLYVIDCRPRPNAEANRALQGGYEEEKHYTFITLEFQNIGNIHVMQNSTAEIKIHGKI